MIELLLFTIVGLLIGSFMNVVVYRLPRMMEIQWAIECAEVRKSEAPRAEALSLSKPRSKCPHCDHQISWYENIPVLSYLLLRGKCSSCNSKISARYPVVEFTTGILFLACATKFGTGIIGAAMSLLAATLLTLALIDWDTTLLPDDITLPLLWLGLVGAEFNLTNITLSNSLWGAIVGYMSLWSIYWLFKIATGKEGMGYGDFKLLAALGAWFGWQALIPIVLISSIIGSVAGISMKLNSNLREGGYIPFGPFLAGAGILTLFTGSQEILKFIGI